MTSEAKLPPLPDPSGLFYAVQSVDPATVRRYSDNQMQAYARQAQRMALEELKQRMNTALEWDINSTCAGMAKWQAESAMLCINKMVNELDAKP